MTGGWSEWSHSGAYCANCRTMGNSRWRRPAAEGEYFPIEYECLGCGHTWQFAPSIVPRPVQGRLQ